MKSYIVACAAIACATSGLSVLVATQNIKVARIYLTEIQTLLNERALLTGPFRVEDLTIRFPQSNGIIRLAPVPHDALRGCEFQVVLSDSLFCDDRGIQAR